MALLEVVARVIRHRLWTKVEGASDRVIVRVVHFDHRTRPGPEGNEADAALVMERALALGMPVEVHALETKPPGNFHDAARKWRYAMLENERAIMHAHLAMRTRVPPSTWILTAHHARDTVETMLLRLARGTGPEGLRGMPLVSPAAHLWRPFARTRVEQIEAYAREARLAWREDPSNAAVDYDRNKVRHGLLPTLAQLNPAYEDAFLRFADAMDDTLSAGPARNFEQARTAPSSPGFPIVSISRARGSAAQQDTEGRSWELVCERPKSAATPEELRRLVVERARAEGAGPCVHMLTRLTNAQWRNLHAHMVKADTAPADVVTRVPLGSEFTAEVARSRLRFVLP